MTKVEKVQKLVSEGDFKSALSIAKTFRFWDSKDDRDAVVLGHEAINHRGFYESIGKDPDSLIEKSIAILKKYYGGK